LNSDLYKTLDGGMTWQFKGKMSGLYSIEFVNPTTGWATGPTGKVKRTTDGGNSWQTSSPTPSYYRAIDFVNPIKGWIVGTAGMIQHTADGGLT
jgi:photosystem II stability/assembly factor-like uncharacterized protein